MKAVLADLSSDELADVGARMGVLEALELAVLKDFADRDLSKADADAEFAEAFRRLDEGEGAAEVVGEGKGATDAVSDAERAWWWLRWQRAGELLAKVTDDEHLPRRELVRKRMSSAAAAVVRHPTDVGSPEVQVVRLTERIAAMQEHLREHKKDKAGRRGLLHMQTRRRKEMKVCLLEASLCQMRIRCAPKYWDGRVGRVHTLECASAI